MSEQEDRRHHWKTSTLCTKCGADYAREFGACKGEKPAADPVTEEWTEETVQRIADRHIFPFDSIMWKINIKDAHNAALATLRAENKILQEVAYHVPLCADHAATWFTERRFNPGDCWFCQQDKEISALRAENQELKSDKAKIFKFAQVEIQRHWATRNRLKKAEELLNESLNWFTDKPPHEKVCAFLAKTHDDYALVENQRVNDEVLAQSDKDATPHPQTPSPQPSDESVPE